MKGDNSVLLGVKGLIILRRGNSQLVNNQKIILVYKIILTAKILLQKQAHVAIRDKIMYVHLFRFANTHMYVNFVRV